MPSEGGNQMQTLGGNLTMKNSAVVCHNHQGMELRASLSRLTRHLAVIEVHHPDLVVRLSEVFAQFQIIVQDRLIYSGRGVVQNLVSTGLGLVCEVALEEASWREVEFSPAMLGNGKLQQEFREFIQEWQKLYRVRPEYKVIIADMQTFLMDLRLWLDQVELSIRSVPAGDRVGLEEAAAMEVAEPVVAAVDALFEKFEAIAGELDEEAEPAHRNYMRRQLHPWILSAPFPYRAFTKPLGYAGDYEMVNMMERNAQEGGSLFAKAIHTWFLRQAPAQAHRNRLQYLSRHLLTETLRVTAAGRRARVQNVACGPAQEVQHFLREQELSSRVNFRLLDFNEETIQYVRSVLSGIQSSCGRAAGLQFVKQSVHAMLKESGRKIARAPEDSYDLVYCAGLFDYLSDQVCQRLMDVMYGWLAPGGLLIATNVEPANPMRHGMEHLLDWHLVYRTGSELRALKPRDAEADAVLVRGDDTGVNVFIEVRKPLHG